VGFYGTAEEDIYKRTFASNNKEICEQNNSAPFLGVELFLILKFEFLYARIFYN